MADARPGGLLKVLCYLSLFASGYILFSGISSFVSGFQIPEQLQVLEEFKERQFGMLQEDDPAIETMENLFRQLETYIVYSKHIAINDTILAAFTLFAVSLMRRGRRQGFYLYVFTAVLGIIIPQLIVSIPFLLFWRIMAYGTFMLLYATQLSKMVDVRGEE